MSEKLQVGDRVRLKGIQFGGHTGTIKEIRRLKSLAGRKMYYVTLDGTALGHSMLRVTKMNIEREP